MSQHFEIIHLKNERKDTKQGKKDDKKVTECKTGK
jgi:hypothetical protein